MRLHRTFKLSSYTENFWKRILTEDPKRSDKIVWNLFWVVNCWQRDNIINFRFYHVLLRSNFFSLKIKIKLLNVLSLDDSFTSVSGSFNHNVLNVWTIKKSEDKIKSLKFHPYNALKFFLVQRLKNVDATALRH